MKCVTQLSDFEGKWSINRDIKDHISGRDSRFDGQAVFTQDQDQLIYHETGKLKLPDAPPMTSERRYFWRAVDGGVAVFFDDDRPFHQFLFTTAASDHWCDPDQYNVEYNFAAWPVWTATWRVKGPRKDYAMHSSYIGL